jgi:hypothetical protein
LLFLSTQPQLPPYVILEIIDWLPYMHVAVSHRRKIALIESVRDSVRKLRRGAAADDEL